MVFCSFCGKPYAKQGVHLQKHELNCRNSSQTDKLMCNLCNKTFVNDRTLRNHINRYHTTQNINNEINDSENLNDFYSDFNISKVKSTSSSSSSINDLDTAFVNNNGNYNKNDNLGLKSFKDQVQKFCIDNKLKFSIALLNINSIVNKFDDIVFILNNQLVDIFVINETKLNQAIDD